MSPSGIIDPTTGMPMGVGQKCLHCDKDIVSVPGGPPTSAVLQQPFFNPGQYLMPAEIVQGTLCLDCVKKWMRFAGPQQSRMAQALDQFFSQVIDVNDEGEIVDPDEPSEKAVEAKEKLVQQEAIGQIMQLLMAGMKDEADKMAEEGKPVDVTRILEAIHEVVTAELAERRGTDG